MQRGLIFGLGAIGLVVAIGLTLAASAFADRGVQVNGDTLIVSAGQPTSPVARAHSSSMGASGNKDNVSAKKGAAHRKHRGRKPGQVFPSPLASPAVGSGSSGPGSDSGGASGTHHVDGDD